MTQATAIPSIVASAPGAVVVQAAAPPLAISEHNCEAAGYCPAEHWREFCRRLGVPVVEVQRGLTVARASDLDAALARMGKPLSPRRKVQLEQAAQRSEDDELAAAGLRRKAAR